MKRPHSYILILLLLMLYSKAYEQTKVQVAVLTGLSGKYYSEKGSEMLVIDSISFSLIKLKNRLLDASVANCDTVARGKWQLFKEGVLRLSDDTSYSKVKYDINSAKRLSNDSVYIKVILPKNAAFFEGRFQYELSLIGNINSIESTNSLIAINKDKAFFKGSSDYHIGFIIHDLYPLNCDLNGKCYQRIYFNVFDDLKLNSNSNYFTITLDNFNECFVEHELTQNELLFVDKDRIYWKGNVYTKRSDNGMPHEVKHLQH